MPHAIRERTLPDGSKRFDVRVELPRDPLTGRRRLAQETFRTKDAAKVRQAEWVINLNNGQVVAPDRITVTQLCHRWLADEAEHRVRPTTLEDYSATIRNHLVPHIGPKRAQALTPADVAALRSTLLRATGTRSVQLALLRLNQVLSWGVSVELLKRNVAQGIKPPRGETPEKRALSHAEARALLEIAATDTYWPLWRVYLATGLRLGEGLGLRWKDLDLGAHTLSVRQQVVLAGKPKRPVIQEPKSVAARRTIDLDPMTSAALRSHRETQRKVKVRAVIWRELDLVFSTRHGTPLNANNVYRNWYVLRDLAGLDPDITPHSLRHTHASHLLDQGVPITEVARRLGHSSPAITLRLYAHLIDGRRGQSVDAVARALDGGLPELGG
jgi:integrase